MAQFTFKLNEYGGTPVTIEAESKEEALSRLEAASPEDIRGAAEQSLRARQSRTGLSDEDISAMLGGPGHQPETSGKIDRARIGAGHSLARAGRGVLNLVDQFIDPERTEQRQQRQRNEDASFASLDAQGFGAEDIGQFVGDAALFLGGGNAKFGYQLLNYGLRGAGFGAASAAAEGSDQQQAAMIGGLTGVVGTASAVGLGKLLRIGGEGLFNLLGMLTAASKRNGMGLSISGSHFMASISRGRTQSMQAIRAARLAGEPVDPSTAVAAATSSQAVRNMTRIIGQLRGADANQFVVATARRALKESMDPQTGVVNPRTMFRNLGELRPSELNAMGPAGKELLRMRNAFGAIAELGNWQRPEIQAAVNGIINNPQKTAPLVTALMRAGNPGTREQIVRAIGRTAGSAPAAAGNAALQNTAQEVTQ